MTEIERVIPITPNGKYAVILPENIPLKDAINIREKIKQWVESKDQFIILYNGVKLMRVDNEATP